MSFAQLMRTAQPAADRPTAMLEHSPFDIVDTGAVSRYSDSEAHLHRCVVLLHGSCSFRSVELFLGAGALLIFGERCKAEALYHGAVRSGQNVDSDSDSE